MSELRLDFQNPGPFPWVGVVLLVMALASLSLTEPVAKSKTDSTLSKEVVFDDAVATDALLEFKSL